VLVETHSLTKRYRQTTALDGCTLGVEQGEVFGLLGPNGAGKTTLLRLLLGYLRPSSGSATIDGLDCRRQSVRIRERVAYLPGEARLFRQMRGRDVLDFFASIRPGGDYNHSVSLAERLEIDLSRSVSLMSTGMRQKLALAATLAANTPLLILDEPTANLDPTIRNVVLLLVVEARAAGRTVIFSSHVLSEVEEICNRVVILRAGQLVHTQNISQLRRQHVISATLNKPLPEVPSHLSQQLTITSDGEQNIRIVTADELSPLLGWLATLPLEEVRIEPVGLKAVYNRYHPSREDNFKQVLFSPTPAMLNTPKNKSTTLS